MEASAGIVMDTGLATCVVGVAYDRHRRCYDAFFI